MKNQVTRILSIGIALVAVATVHAQDKTVTANVPFRFYVGSSLMPQGVYRVSDTSHGTMLYLRSMDSDAAKAVMARNIVGKLENEPARLVFHCYGQNCFLAEIWSGDKPTGGAISPSQHEREIAQAGEAPTLAVIRIASPQ